MPVRSVPATSAGTVPGLLRRAWRAVAAVAGAVRARRRAVGPRQDQPRVVPAVVRAVRRRLGAGGRRAAARPVARPWTRPLGLDYGCVAWSESWPHRLPLRVTLDGLCHFASLHPAVWAGPATLPTDEEWRDSSLWHRWLLEDIARNDPERPLRALRLRARRRVAAAGTPRPAPRTLPAARRGWPPALASPRPG